MVLAVLWQHAVANHTRVLSATAYFACSTIATGESSLLTLCGAATIRLKWHSRSHSRHEIYMLTP